MPSPRWFVFALTVLAVACGGSEPAARSADSADGSAPSDARADGSGTDESSGDGEESTAEAPSAPSCDDGTCTTCGDALCPSGWYCDEGAPGGPACGWLPECATKSTCACVKRAFSGCRCEDEGGAAHLSCR